MGAVNSQSAKKAKRLTMIGISCPISNGTVPHQRQIAENPVHEISARERGCGRYQTVFLRKFVLFDSQDM
jgi:hypothetical protein